MYVCVCVGVCVCARACECAYAHMYVCVCVCVRASICIVSVCMYACMGVQKKTPAKIRTTKHTAETGFISRSLNLEFLISLQPALPAHMSERF